MRPTILLALTMLLFCSCQLHSSNIKRNDEISTADRLAIKKMVLNIHRSIQTHDARYISQILTNELKKKLVTPHEAVANLLQTIELDSVNFLRSVELECQVNSSRFKPITEVTSERNRFIVTFPAHPKVYIYLFSVASHIPGVKYLVTNVFFKEKNDWKLGIFYIGEFSFNGRTSHDLYSEATGAYYNGDMFDAFVKANLMTQCLKPGGEYFEYELQDAIVELDKDIRNALAEKISFPIVLDKIASKPEVFALAVKLANAKAAPLIAYKTALPLSGRAALEKENGAIHAQLERYLEGIKLKFDTLYYTTMNEYPNNYREVATVDFAKANE